jgi:hypothetical protein
MSAIIDIFSARAKEAKVLGRLQRKWPARVIAYSHWLDAYKIASESAGIDLSLEDAVKLVNDWIDAF